MVGVNIKWLDHFIHPCIAKWANLVSTICEVILCVEMVVFPKKFLQRRPILKMGQLILEIYVWTALIQPVPKARAGSMPQDFNESLAYALCNTKFGFNLYGTDSLDKTRFRYIRNSEHLIENIKVSIYLTWCFFGNVASGTLIPLAFLFTHFGCFFFYWFFFIFSSWPKCRPYWSWAVYEHGNL